MPSNLLHSPSEILRQWLVDAGYAAFPDNTTSTPWQAFDHKEPNKPDQLIAVFDEEIEDHGRDGVESERQEYFGVRIRIRSPLKETASAKANAIATLGLDKLSLVRVTLDSSVYRIWTFIRRSGPMFVGDASNNDVVTYTINGVMPIRRLS